MARLHSTITVAAAAAAARMKPRRIFTEYKNKRMVQALRSVRTISDTRGEKQARLTLSPPPTCFFLSRMYTHTQHEDPPPSQKKKQTTQPSSSHFDVTASLLFVSFVRRRLCGAVYMSHAQNVAKTPTPHLHPPRLISGRSN